MKGKHKAVSRHTYQKWCHYCSTEQTLHIAIQVVGQFLLRYRGPRCERGGGEEDLWDRSFCVCAPLAAPHPDFSRARSRPGLTAICSTSWDQSVGAGKSARAPAQPRSGSCRAGTAPACLVEVGERSWKIHGLDVSLTRCMIDVSHD